MKEYFAINQIRVIIKKERLSLFALATLSFLITMLSVALLILLLETIFRFYSQTRTFIFIAFWILFIALFTKQVLPKLLILLKKIDGKEIINKALELGKNNPEIKDELANAIELSENTGENYSSELIEAYINNVLQKVDEKFFKIKNPFVTKKIVLNIVLLVLLFTLPITIKPLRNATFRVWNYNKEFKLPPEFTFEVTPGNTTIAKGDSILISVSINGKQPEEFYLYGKKQNEADFSVWRKFGITKSKYFYRLDKTEIPFEYFFTDGKVFSDTFAVDVITPPYVRKLEAKIIPPRYTKEKPYLSDDGNISALQGTRVKLKVVANKPIAEARVIFSCKKKIPFNINGKELTASFIVRHSCNYKISLYDSTGYVNRYPVNYFIKAEEDEFPTIKILTPGKDIELGNEDVIPLVIKISDDYGISKLLLHYKLISSGFGKPTKSGVLSIKTNGDNEQTVLYDWNLHPLKIEVNDVYEYYAEVFDNDKINGRKKAVSKKFKIYLPPLEKFLANAEKENKARIKEFEKTLREAENLKKEMQKLSYDLMRNKVKPSWQEKQKLKNVVNKFEKLAKQAEELSKKLATQGKKLEKRNLLSPETIKKYEELQKLLSQLNDETLKRLFKKMSQSIDKDNLKNIRKELENLKKNEEAFRKSIERTMKLFKRLLAEQKTDELLKRIDEIQKEQNRISKELQKKNLPSKKLNELTQRQQNLKNKIEDLKKEAEKLSDIMKDLEDMPKEEMQKFNEQMQKQNNEKLAEQASENMMMRNFQSAIQQQNQLNQNMQQLMKQMQNVQNAMRMENQMKTMAEMMRLTQEIIYLSEQEEALKNKINSSNLSNSEIRRLAEKQNEILSQTDFVIRRMQKLSNKTFAITPEMGNAIGKARMRMKDAIGDLEERSRFGAKNKTNSAMASLNEAADLMQSMLNAMANQQGNGQGGMMSLMQQLKQMSGMQMQINSQTKQMKGRGKSQQQLAQMQRLASQQAALQKSLEQLNKEAKASGESKKIAGDLERIAEEMKEIVTDLKTGNIDDELIKKQEHILARMLDAQRSINERDFEKRRESEQGKEITGKLPPQLKLQNEKKTDLEKELLEAEKEGYKKDYRELIKKYYKELQNTEK